MIAHIRQQLVRIILLTGFIFFHSVVLFPSMVSAHELRPAIIDLNLLEEQRLEMSIRLNLEALLAEIEPGITDTDDSMNAERYDELRGLSPEELGKAFANFKPTLLANMQLEADGKPLSLNQVSLTTPVVEEFELVRDSVLVLSGEYPASAKVLRWQWSENFGAAALRVSSIGNPDLYTAYLQGGDASADIPLEDGEKVQQSAMDVFIDYTVIGFEHILPKGLDHILFVAGLFLLSARLKPLFWQVTSFTLAHSITLALGVLGIVNISPSIVEPLIAASIVYVCIENIISESLNKWRPFIVMAFGLLHGLGFAGVLMEIGLSEDQFLMGLIAFNVGVEIGQITVIATCFLLIGLWFREKPWYRQRITIPASALIGCIGAYWFVERVFLG